MGRTKKIYALLGGLALAALCSGCGAFSGDDLYALPKQSDAYYELQKAIDSTLPGDAAYSGPLTGSNQQAVQLADLNGDGHDEAIVFARTTGEKPLKLYIFDRSSGAYENTAVIEGDGSAFDCVEYAQLDGKPGMEILVGRQVSDQIAQSLGIYAYDTDSRKEILSTVYSEFKVVDLDQDDKKEVLVLRQNVEERTGAAELFHFSNGVMERYQETSLSVGIEQIRRIMTGHVTREVPAVFVTSSMGENTIVTDILAFADKKFTNLTANTESGLAIQKVRNYNAYPTDLDDDGIVELPMPVVLPSASAEEDTHWIIQWFNLSLEGGRRLKMTTYHNYAGGWYLELPKAWCSELTVSRRQSVEDVVGYTFSRWHGYDREPEELFTIFAFTGERRLELSQAQGRMLLAEKGETAYAASLGTCPWVQDLRQEDLSAMFHFIDVDWNSGET